MLVIPNNAVVLFQGDSITDVGRNREESTDLGSGYVMMAASWFNATHPKKHVKFLNRGVSGDVATGLRARWQEDCLDLKPTIVSIMIGINDCFLGVENAVYEEAYRSILTDTNEKLNAELILIEPFGVPASINPTPRPDLDIKINIVRKLAREFKATLIPMDGIFAKASTLREPDFWAPDSVHPTSAGHALMARAWLEAVGAL